MSRAMDLMPGRTQQLAVLSVAVAWVCSVPVRAPAGENESSLRRQAAWQVALDNLGFSPGLIDGHPGAKTKLATSEFQRVHGLPATGELDAATAQAMKVAPDNVFGRYVIEPADLAEIGPVPKTWLARSKLTRLGHESIGDVLVEKFHCSAGLLATLNPGKEINHLKPGDKVVVPLLAEPADWPQAAYLTVNLAEKVIRVIDSHERLVALFHCSIAASKTKLPSQNATVAKVAKDPMYTFDPKMWPEVKENIPGPIEIPPGPRNPVGRFWIGLSLPGYGIHGTPNPELIGKTGSHGCFRMTNWDAVRLGKMVRIGTPVRFENQPTTRSGGK